MVFCWCQIRMEGSRLLVINRLRSLQENRHLLSQLSILHFLRSALLEVAMFLKFQQSKTLDMKMINWYAYYISKLIILWEHLIREVNFRSSLRSKAVNQKHWRDWKNAWKTRYFEHSSIKKLKSVRSISRLTHPIHQCLHIKLMFLAERSTACNITYYTILASFFFFFCVICKCLNFFSFFMISDVGGKLWETQG